MSTNFTIRQLDSSERDAHYSLRLRALEAPSQAFAALTEEWRHFFVDRNIYEVRPASYIDPIQFKVS